MTTWTVTAMTAAEYADCDLTTGRDLARIQAALEQREELLDALEYAISKLELADEQRFDAEGLERIKAVAAKAKGKV